MAKSLAIILSLILILCVICNVLAFQGVMINDNLRYLTGLAKFGGLVLMVKEGTTFKKRYFSIILPVLFTLIFIGTLFKIMHWPFANIMLFSGLGAMSIVYLIAFLLKKEKHM